MKKETSCHLQLKETAAKKHCRNFTNYFITQQEKTVPQSLQIKIQWVCSWSIQSVKMPL